MRGVQCKLKCVNYSFTFNLNSVTHTTIFTVSIQMLFLHCGNWKLVLSIKLRLLTNKNQLLALVQMCILLNQWEIFGFAPKTEHAHVDSMLSNPI